MYTKTEGSYKGTCTIGQAGFTDVNLSGTIKPVDGLLFGAVWEEPSFNFSPGYYYKRMLRVNAGGQEKVKISIDEPEQYKKLSSMIRITAPDVTINGGESTLIPVTFHVRPGYKDDWNLSIPLTVSAYNGNKTTVVNANLHIETMWAVHKVVKTVKFPNLSSWDFLYEDTLSINSDGMFFWDVEREGHSGYVTIHRIIEEKIDGSGKFLAFRLRSLGSTGRTSQFQGLDLRLKKCFDANGKIPKIKAEFNPSSDSVTPFPQTLLLVKEFSIGG